MIFSSKNNSKILYVFLHLPKTGGTTFEHHLYKNFPVESLLYVSLDESQPIKSKRDLEQKIYSLTKEQKNKLKIIFGHSAYFDIDFLFPGREVRYILFLREPVSRVISHYNYYLTRLSQGAKDQQEEFNYIKRIISGEPGKNNFLALTRQKYPEFNNLIFSFLKDHLFDEKNNYESSEIAKRLKKFYFIGIAEDSNDFDYLLGLLGCKKFYTNKNISAKFLAKKNFTMEEISFLAQSNDLDEQIYQWGLNINRTFKLGNKEYYKIVKKTKRKKQAFKYLHPYKFYDMTLIQPIYIISNHLKKYSRSYLNTISSFKKIFKMP